MKLKLLLFILSAIYLEALHAEQKVFPNIDNFDELEKIVYDETCLEPKALIVVDIDETLIDNGPLDKYISNYFFNTKFLPYPEDRELCLSSYIRNKENVPVHEDQASWFNNLQKTTKVICLTSCKSGSYGSIKDFRVQRYQALKTLNYKIKNPFKKLDNEFSFSFKGKTAAYYNGIIFTNDFTPDTTELYEKTLLSNKGLVLTMFLRLLESDCNWKPSKIIFIDDNLLFINSVREALWNLPVDASIIHYTAVYHKEDRQRVEKLSLSEKLHEVLTMATQVLNKAFKEKFEKFELEYNKKHHLSTNELELPEKL